MSDEDTSQDEAEHPFETVADDESSSESDRDPLAGDESDDEEVAGIQTQPDESGSVDEAPADDERERDLEKWEDRLDQREEGLDLRAEKLKDRAEELDAREGDLDAEREELDEWRSDLEARQQRLDQREQDLDDREAAIRERENELAERAADLDEKEQTLHTYVADNLGDVESKITDAVRGSISTAMQDIEPGKAEVDQESVDETVSAAIDSAMADHRKGRFGTPGNIVFGLFGLLLVAGGVSVVFLAESANFTQLFADELANYGAAAALVLIGLAVNLTAAAGRL